MIVYWIYSKDRDVGAGYAPTTCPILFEHYEIFDYIIYISPISLVETFRVKHIYIATRRPLIELE